MKSECQPDVDRDGANNSLVTSPELSAVLSAAREVDRRLYHEHRSEDGSRYGRGGCYSTRYEACGEHHMHDMKCGEYPRWCSRRESEPEVNALHAALVALEKRR